MRLVRIAALAAGLLAAGLSFAEETERGELIWRDPTCFFFVLKTEHGYGLFEFLGGPSPMVGHTFEGKLEGFGSRRIMNATENKPTMVYSEVFESSQKLLLRKIPKQCKRKKELEALFQGQPPAPAAPTEPAKPDPAG
jgi:hypothetical protein